MQTLRHVYPNKAMQNLLVHIKSVHEMSRYTSLRHPNIWALMATLLVLVDFGVPAKAPGPRISTRFKVS
ncbi:hypothetical protein EIP86_008915 [Pleurotus ostreatoroseus]|nr:hypothetical protein EIP86_008915 [Pleurotus ostreatoroseus]